MPTLRRPTTVLALAASAVFFTAGGAYGYWSVNGSGTGLVTVATVRPLVIEQTGVTDLALGRPADLNATVTNPNDFEASLLGTEVTVTVVPDATHRDCDTTNFAIKAPTTKAKLIKANDRLKLHKGSITMLNATTDQAACHGATLTLEYVLKQAPAASPGKAPAAPRGASSTAEPTTPCTSRQTPPSSVEPTAEPTSTTSTTAPTSPTSTTAAEAPATTTAQATSVLP